MLDSGAGGQGKTPPRLFVQYGCGLAAPDSWTNFDASPRLRFERLPGVGAAAGALGKRLFPANVQFGDIVRGLPIADGTVDGVYASHVLEHLSRDDVKTALGNTYRILKPGGIYRLIVPDLAWRAERYVRDRREGKVEAADAFIKACHFRDAERVRGPMGLLRATIGNAGHQWMYDRELMTKLLKEAGFVDIHPCKFKDSGEPMFDAVEHPGRFVDSGEDEAALQARKPGTA
jgi:SAM-dependent methyltransferase